MEVINADSIYCMQGHSVVKCTRRHKEFCNKIGFFIEEKSKVFDNFNDFQGLQKKFATMAEVLNAFSARHWCNCTTCSENWSQISCRIIMAILKFGLHTLEEALSFPLDF